jgi:hypothetical protein
MTGMLVPGGADAGDQGHDDDLALDLPRHHVV